MDTKKIIIIALTIILVSIIAIGAYFYTSDTGLEYQTINLTSTCSIDIPVSDNITNKTYADNIMILNDTQNDVLIASYNSADGSLSSLITDATQLAALRDSYKINSEQLTIANETVWFNEATGYYMAFLGNDTTHDNILIVTKDNETLEHMIKSVKYSLGDSSDVKQASSSSVVTSNDDNEKSDEDLEFDDVYYDDSYDYDDSDVGYSGSSSSSSYADSGSTTPTDSGSTTPTDSGAGGSSGSGGSSSDYEEDFSED